MGSRGQQQHGIRPGVLIIQASSSLSEGWKRGGVGFLHRLCEVSRESAQEDHPSGAERRVRIGEEELRLCCVQHRALIPAAWV